jgi:tRNA threonylcarbamoyladenosine biosynthesis protein TsaE
MAFAIDLPDEKATAALASELAACARGGDVIGLSGPLGSGKTTFARFFIGAKMRASSRASQEVPSPTFTLVETYQPETGPAIWHFDLYRIEKPEEAYELGIEDAFAEGIALIEWPERLGALLPREHLGIALAPGARVTSRVATVTPTSLWQDRIVGLKRG